ncbi:uncharacterized protein LOC135941808 [Cloeon dipterum]|uniref:uncharacterized protein LOC135941808 n=1 Tax=Cloeon dipterum TaxID=197152 RepID=UPI00321FE5B7
MSPKMFLFTVLVGYQLFSIAGAQMVISTLDPSRYPYIVRLRPSVTSTFTGVGLIVSSRFILAQKTFSFSNIPATGIEITEQTGKIQFAAVKQSIVGDKYAYLKVCRKFNGATYPMTSSRFSSLASDNPNTTMLFFNTTSPVLQEVSPFTVMSASNCTTFAWAPSSGELICIYRNLTPGSCLFFTDDPRNYYQAPVLVINGHPHGFLSGYSCSSDTITSTWYFYNFGYDRAALIQEIPEVTIQ